MDAMTEEAKRTRHDGETARWVTEDMADTLRTGLEGLQVMARTLHEAAERSVGASPSWPGARRARPCRASAGLTGSCTD